MKKMSNVKNILVVGIGLILALFIAGSGLAKELLPMKVSYLPIMDCQQLYVAWEKGYFEEEGLMVEAYVKGFDFAFIGAGGFFDTTNRGAAGILVKKDSPIQSVKELANKKIAINALQSVNHLAVLTIADFHGVDIKTLKFVEVPMPSQPPALKEGAVDACHNVQPFIAASEREGITRLLYGGFYPPEIAPRAMISSWFAKKSTLEKNKEKLTRFLKAVTKATEFINKNPDQLPAIVAKYTKLDPNLLVKMAQPKFYTTVNKKDIQVSIDLCAKYGFIKNGFDAKEIVATNLLPLQ
jgi:ABC-type nitrate/sulfonate/bicarbonate transport system substrate-binding protein